MHERSGHRPVIHPASRRWSFPLEHLQRLGVQRGGNSWSRAAGSSESGWISSAARFSWVCVVPAGHPLGLPDPAPGRLRHPEVPVRVQTRPRIPRLRPARAREGSIASGLRDDPRREHRPVRLGHGGAGSARAALQRAHALHLRADPERGGRGRDRAGVRALRRSPGGTARWPPLHRSRRPRRLRGRYQREVRRPDQDRAVRHRLQVRVRLHEIPAHLQRGRERGRAFPDRDVRPAVCRGPARRRRCAPAG